MSSPKADLILNPIRFRILTAISSYRMAAKEIAEALPDIPQTTLYRHINALVEGGLLKIVDEKPIRGTIERIYALPAPPSLAPEDLHGMTRQEGEQVFTMFLSTLMNDAQQYLNGKPVGAAINPIEDGVQITKVQLFLDDEEMQRMSSKFMELILEATKNQPAAGRLKRILSIVVLPGENNLVVP
jgi:DNA-binding transcriptional ArsR family regulator